MQSFVRSVAHGDEVLRIGTRGSPLALAQANEVRDRLASIHGGSPALVRLEIIRTTGDLIRDRPLTEIGGKGLFTKEIEQALLAGSIDAAVHSAKDMPTVLPPGLGIAAVPPREDPRDVFISPKARSLRDLPKGASVGTASPRRQALVKRLRPDLSVVSIRGNVGTRLAKLQAGAVDAIVLALAGLKRLGIADMATAVLEVEEFLPAAGQGIMAVETRADDTRVLPFVAVLNDPPSASALSAERAFLTVLEGSCRTPIAAYAVLRAGRLYFRGLIAKPDGSEHFSIERDGSVADAVLIGTDAGRELRARAGTDFFRPA